MKQLLEKDSSNDYMGWRNTVKVMKIFALLFLPVLSTLSVADTTTITYFHQDMVGSPVAASSENGTVLWRKEYQPLGKTVDADGTNHIGYTGHVEDKSTGLSYMQQRYYDPEIGRFYSNDPVGFTDQNLMSFNRYKYGNNNPYRFIDPDGNSEVKINDENLGVMDAAELKEHLEGMPDGSIQSLVMNGHGKSKAMIMANASSIEVAGDGSVQMKAVPDGDIVAGPIGDFVDLLEKKLQPAGLVEFNGCDTALHDKGSIAQVVSAEIPTAIVVGSTDLIKAYGGGQVASTEESIFNIIPSYAVQPAAIYISGQGLTGGSRSFFEDTRALTH